MFGKMLITLIFMEFDYKQKNNSRHEKHIR